MATLYSKLGVAEDASAAEIKRAYRKAAMKWHPDRNAGNEEAVRTIFLEIKDAYEILSDPEKRKVYDLVYATEMHRWETQQKRQRQRQHQQHQQQHQQQQRDHERSERARRERAEQAAAEARYAERVTFAMRFAEQGHNRDVIFGVLLGRDCPPLLAARIADSVWALHQSRAGAPHANAARRKTAARPHSPGAS
ncbi:J domain-containing protein, partial [Paraburkholderia solisilvae]